MFALQALHSKWTSISANNYIYIQFDSKYEHYIEYNMQIHEVIIYFLPFPQLKAWLLPVYMMFYVYVTF